MVSLFTGCSADEGERALLKSIYQVLEDVYMCLPHPVCVYQD